MQVTALGPVPVKGLAEPVEVFELIGRQYASPALAGRCSAGPHPLCGAAAGAGGAAPGPGAGAGGPRPGRRPGGEAGVGKSRLVYEFVHSHHTQGWRVLESPSVSYGKATPYFPVIDLLKRYCHVEEPDDHRTMRAKVTGQVLTFDEALQDTTPGPAGAARRPASRQPVPDARAAPTPPAHAGRRSSACCCAKARYSPCCWSLKTCTGLMPRRRRCSTAWSRACRRPGCCSWSTTAPSTSTAGAARPPIRSSGSTRCPRRVPTHSCRPCWGTTPAWRRSRSS